MQILFRLIRISKLHREYAVTYETLGKDEVCHTCLCLIPQTAHPGWAYSVGRIVRHGARWKSRSEVEAECTGDPGAQAEWEALRE